MNAPQHPELDTLTLNGATRALPWARLDDERPVPASGPVLLPLPRAVAEAPPLLERGRDVALLVAPDDDVGALAGWAKGLAFVAVDFPKVLDGRGSTHARRLRDDVGYAGPVVAVGHVILDQLHYLARAGFDHFALAEGELADARAALARFSHFYVGVKTHPRDAVFGAGR